MQKECTAYFDWEVIQEDFIYRRTLSLTPTIRTNMPIPHPCYNQPNTFNPNNMKVKKPHKSTNFAATRNPKKECKI